MEALDFEDALGESLQRPLKDQDRQLVDTSAALAGKSAVALYFTADYCKSCKAFTPKLLEAQQGSFGEITAIVTISCDRTE